MIPEDDDTQYQLRGRERRREKLVAILKHKPGRLTERDRDRLSQQDAAIQRRERSGYA